MLDENKTKEQLIKELVQVRQRIAELEGIETAHKLTGEALLRSKADAEGVNRGLEKAHKELEVSSRLQGDPGRQRQIADSDPSEVKTIDKAATEETEVFDSRGLLKRLDGDEELFDELLDLYLQDVPVRLKELRHALEDNDIVLGVRQAHTIMGASANIGANSLRDMAFEMEMAARDNNLDKALPFCRRLEKEFAKFRSMLSGSVLSDNEKQQKED